ncbi:ABC transporter substrate-binding protein [Marinobacter sp. CHS3-4]|uniref:ABC transporter substrate-binding protein n=1 Tax=Marinobacter sp. CHS3-4 TaxID=3045174 RepID=UPI0024B4C2BE|nr:ABC transporter substrate-binding protein [Marinobacter sp. CHS3-4]MDI9245313.1 ABC transporter substrate-binding protein [Marinobacter sp. CHS3-4]
MLRKDATQRLFVLSKASIAVLLLSILSYPLSLNAEQAAPVDVVFLSPDDSRFWQMTGGFMQAVAEDLDVNLTIYTDISENRFSYRDLLKKVLQSGELPDYVLLMCKEKVTYDMLEMIGEAGVKAFTFNTDVPDDELRLTGMPREKMAHWIGHLSPDNHSAGLNLADRLYERFKDEHGTSPSKMVGLSGSRDSSASIDRNRGFNAMLAVHPSLEGQLLFANWSETEAVAKTIRLFERYPELDLIWSASDGMALGAITAAEQKGRVPGEDVLIGGVDWETRALDEIENGRLELSLGRHFMGGGLALLLIRDYHSGYDFNREPPATLSYQFVEANRDNLESIRNILDRAQWAQTDFRKFSRQFNEALRGSPVSASGILDDFMSAMSPGIR